MVSHLLIELLKNQSILGNKKKSQGISEKSAQVIQNTISVTKNLLEEYRSGHNGAASKAVSP